PVSARDVGWEVTAKLVAVRVEGRLAAAVIGSSSTEIESGVNITGVRRVEDHRDVERLWLHLEQRVADPVPPHLTGTVEVHVGRGFEVVVKTDIRIGRADTRLTAVSAH